MPYRQALNSTISTLHLHGQKLNEDRISFLPCCNIEYTERLVRNLQDGLPIQDAFKYPQLQNIASNITMLPSRGRIGAFFDRLHKFDAYIGQTKGRRGFLLIDYPSCYGTVEDLSTLSNEVVRILSKKITSILQSPGAGVIASIKQKY